MQAAGGLGAVGEQEFLDDRFCAGLAVPGEGEMCLLQDWNFSWVFMWLLLWCPLFTLLPVHDAFLNCWLGDSYYPLSGISNTELDDSQWESVAQQGAELGSQVL